jgi:hypothetical protein
MCSESVGQRTKMRADCIVLAEHKGEPRIKSATIHTKRNVRAMQCPPLGACKHRERNQLPIILYYIFIALSIEPLERKKQKQQPTHKTAALLSERTAMSRVKFARIICWEYIARRHFRCVCSRELQLIRTPEHTHTHLSGYRAIIWGEIGSLERTGEFRVNTSWLTSACCWLPPSVAKTPSRYSWQ